MQHWIAIELDFQDWGIDLDACLDARPWRWFHTRVVGLIANPNSRLYKALERKLDARADGS